MSINKCMLSGNIVRDAELRSSGSGMTVLSFSVAVNERRKSADGDWGDYPNYIDCKMFGKRADAVYPFLRKGTKVAIEGRVHQDRWEDRDSGQKRSKVSVNVDEIEFMSRREGRAQSEPYADENIPF